MPLTEQPRLHPHDLEAEQAVLGAVLFDPAALARAQEVLRPEDFYDGRHQRIFLAMIELAGNSQPVDLITLSDSLDTAGELSRIGGRAMLAEIFATVASASNVAHHAQIVRDCAVLRALIRLSVELQERAYTKDSVTAVVGDAERRICEIALGRERRSACSMAEVVRETVDYIDRVSKRAGEIVGIPTGFHEIDGLLGGWQRSDLVVIGARPGMGKTSFALGTMLAAAEAGYRVGFVSLEMPRLQLGLRLHGMKASIDVQALRIGRMTPQGWTVLATAAQYLESLPVWIDDSSDLTVEQVVAKARHQKTRHGLDLLVLDYLQLLQMPDAETRQQGVAEASRRLKLLAKELDLTVLALSQLSREPQRRAENRPELSDLRDSGAIEQDADIVLFLFREEINNRNTREKGIAEVLVRKHRNGPIGDRRLRFVDRFARFEDLS